MSARTRLVRRVVATIAAGALVVAACGGDDDSSSTTAPPTEDAPNDETDSASDDEAPEPGVGEGDFSPSGTIEVWMHATPGNVLFEELFAQYESEFPDVSIELLEIPFADFETNSLRSTSAGDGPDLIKLSGWVLPDWADKDLLVPVTGELLGYSDDDELFSDWEPEVFEGVSFEDVPYALPVDFQNLMLFYNRSHFEEAGLDPDSPPSTWEEVLEVGEELTVRSGDRVDRAGYSWWYTTEIWVYLEMETLAAQLGGSVLNDDASEGALSSGPGREALDFYLDMSNEHRIASFDLIDTGVLDLFADERASMLISGSFTDTSIAARTDGALSIDAGTLGVAPMPSFAEGASDATAAYSWGWGVTTNAEDPKPAGHLARWLTAPEQADRIFAEIGLATPYLGFGASEAAQASEANQILVEQVERAVYGPRSPQFTAMMTELTQQIQAGASGQSTADEVGRRFDEAMQRVLG